MTSKNKIFLIGNGFDIAHRFKTKFSDFADHFIEDKITPQLIHAIKNRYLSDPFFNDSFLTTMAHKGGGVIRKESFQDLIWHYSYGNRIDELKKYLSSHYAVLESILTNSLLAKLYSGTDKNWFDIEKHTLNNWFP